jgi:tetratricopeptide (TPR) repeat protein
LRLFNSAIELDPDFAAAYGRAASCYAFAKGNFSVTVNEIGEAKRLAQRAVELGKDDAIALATGGWALAYVVRDLEVGAALIDRALVLNSNFAEAWLYGAWAKNWLGEPEAAIERFTRAMRLSPLDPRGAGMRSGTLARFFVAVLIGVGGTLAWQFYGDAAREAVIVRAPTLAWLLSVSTTKSPAATATSAAPVQQQLEPLAFNIDLVRRIVEQLAAKQDQMAQNIATLQGVQEDIRQKMSYTPPSPSQQAASIQQPKPPQPKAQSSAVQSSPATRPPAPAGPLVLTR